MMSGGICVCACEGNHHSSHQCSRPASISAIAARPPGARGHRSPAVRGVSGEAGFDAVPGGGASRAATSERGAVSPLFFIFPPFLHPPSAESRVPAADASLSKQNEQYLTFFSRTSVG